MPNAKGGRAGRGSLREPLLRACFGGPDGLLANEYAYWNPGAEVVRASSAWDVPAGSLFRRDGCGWTGVPDRRPPGPLSERGTGSAVFRAVTRRADFGAASAALALRLDSLLEPAQAFLPSGADGVRLLLRWDEGLGYELSLARRDGSAWILKDGLPLAGPFEHSVPFGRWTRLRAESCDLTDGSVSLKLWADGRLVAWARDADAPRRTGRAGLAGDNADFMFAEFEIRGLSGPRGG